MLDKNLIGNKMMYYADLVHDLGWICQDFRKEHGYLQRDIAKDLGIQQTTVSNFETGVSKSSDTFIWYIMHGLTAKYIIDKRRYKANERI